MLSALYSIVRPSVRPSVCPQEDHTKTVRVVLVPDEDVVVVM